MLLKNYKKLFFLKVVFLAIWFALFFLLNSYTSSDISQEYNNNLVFILDVSHSMNVQDCENKYWVPITRLALAKKIISKQMEIYDKYRYWLILFAGTANYYLPPTLDKDNFLLYLNNLNTGLLPAWGTNIYWWIKTFLDSDWQDSSAVMLTDWWDNSDFATQKNNIENLIQKTKNFKDFYIIGVGTQEWGMVKYPNGEVLNMSGNIIKSSVNISVLQNLSKILHTPYIKIDNERNIKPFLIITKQPNSFQISDTHRTVIELIWSLFIIFGI